MVAIIDEVLSHLPRNQINAAVFEGAKIVLYTKNPEFFLTGRDQVKKVVDLIKKRVELRPDPSITKDPETAEKIIKKLLPKEAGLTLTLFDPERSIVIIEAEKPGIVIGKKGELLQAIRKKTLWVPIVRRTPPIKSQLIEDIRSVLYKKSEYRRKFLHSIGERIYSGWKRGQRYQGWIRVSILGGAREVGRSALLLQTPESRVLLDCGVNVASITDAYPHLEAPEFNIKELDAVIVTHAHIDHSGLVPYLFKFGYKGPVYCTEPTRDIMALLQLDLIKIQKQQGLDPLYTSDEVEETVVHTVTLDYEEVTDITPDVRITLYNAGHILGSSMVHLHIGNGLHNLLYTGDIKFSKTNLLSPAATKFPRLESLIIESTYGGKDNIMPSQQEIDSYLVDIVKKTIKRGGKILMPVLGVGRAQDVLILIQRLIKSGDINPIPIYVDGMVWDITAIHTAYPEFLNTTVRKEIFQKNDNPFLAENIKRVGSAKEREQVIKSKKPCIILATSGMLVGGPSVEYLKHLAENPKNTLIFTSYQGEGTLGRRIQQGEREIGFKEAGKTFIVKINMEVGRLEISGHADRKELINFVRRCDPRPRKVIVVHGENSRCIDLASSIHRLFKMETTAPRNLEVVRLR